MSMNEYMARTLSDVEELCKTRDIQKGDMIYVFSSGGYYVCTHPENLPLINAFELFRGMTEEEVQEEYLKRFNTEGIHEG